VFGDNQKPVGIMGKGINLSDFINAINHNLFGTDDDELYFFNAAGEIIKAKDINLALPYR
jgi:methyl-accepting chemotaxis protein